MNYSMHSHYMGSLKWVGAVLFFLLSFGVATQALAATMAVSPKEITLHSGDTFSVRYSIDPQGEKNYTTKLILGFAPRTLKVESFQFGANWIPLSQPGYDLVDAVSGTLIKTAGYPAGLSAPTLFATVRFKVTGTANGTVTLQDGSLVLNAKNENVLQKQSVITRVIVVAAPAVEIVPPEPEKNPNLFDVELGVSPVQSSFNWLSWAIVALALCLGVMCGIEVRRWYRKRNAFSL